RKKLILDRLRLLSASEQLGDVQDVVNERVDDPDVKELLQTMLANYEAQQGALAEESVRSGQAALDAAMRSLAVKERTWLMRKSLLEREPVAVVVGSVLLVLVTLALVVGMFAKVAAPEILANAFLLILGFFFGQSGSFGNRRSASDGSSGLEAATTIA